MKKLILSLIILALAFVPFAERAPHSAEAASNLYVEALGNDVEFFYHDAKLFNIPKTYFAKYERHTETMGEDTFYTVNYLGIPGKIKASASVKAPAANSTVDTVGMAPAVTLTLKGDAQMKKYNPLNVESITEETVEAASNPVFVYFGSHFFDGDANEYIFVLNETSGHHGWILRSAFQSFTIGVHKVTADRLAAEEAANAEKTPDISEGGSVINNKTLRIILIAGTAIPALLIIILLFKPQKRRPRYSAPRYRASAPYQRYRDYEDYPPRYERTRPRREDDYYEDDY